MKSACLTRVLRSSRGDEALRRSDVDAHTLSVAETSDDGRIEIALESLGAEFGSVVQNLEARFLPLGEDLREVVGQLQRLTTMAGDGFAALRQEMTSGSLGELESLALRSIEHVHGQLGEVARRLQPLEKIAERLGQVRSLGNDLRRIGSFLCACGINFAMETARREDSQKAYAGFVNELRDLAGQIVRLAEEMNTASNATLKLLHHARTRIQENLTKVRELAGAMHAAFSAASGEIRQLVEDMCESMNRVERHRQAISKHTGAIVYYLQFGDLVRQQCEHIVDAVHDARVACESEDPEERRSVPFIVRTALSQMELAHREVVEAGQKLSDSYVAVEEELRQFGRECRPETGGASVATNGTAAWARLKRQLEELDKIQGHGRNLSRDTQETAQEASRAAASLHEGLSSICTISGKLHFLALNAIVQTTRLGDEGRTLGELSKQVNASHRECEGIVPKVLNLLDSLDGCVSDLEGRETEGQMLDLQSLLALEQVQTASRDMMDKMLELVVSGGNDVARRRHDLKIFDFLANEIAGYRASLTELQRQLPPFRRSDLAPHIEAKLLARYTMQQERDIHLQAHSEGRAHQKASATPVAAAAGADDLGDNIELF